MLNLGAKQWPQKPCQPEGISLYSAIKLHVGATVIFRWSELLYHNIERRSAIKLQVKQAPKR